MEIQNGTMQYELTSTGFGGPVDTLCTPTSWRKGAKETDFQDIYTCTTCEIETTTCAQPHSKSSGLHTCTLSSFPGPIWSFYGVWEWGSYLHAPGSPTYLISIQCGFFLWSGTYTQTRLLLTGILLLILQPHASNTRRLTKINIIKVCSYVLAVSRSVLLVVVSEPDPYPGRVWHMPAFQLSTQNTRLQFGN